VHVGCAENMTSVLDERSGARQKWDSGTAPTARIGWNKASQTWTGVLDWHVESKQKPASTMHEAHGHRHIHPFQACLHVHDVRGREGYGQYYV
jgi:hypothetical protein